MDWSMLIAVLAFVVGYTIFAGKGDKGNREFDWKQTGKKKKKK